MKLVKTFLAATAATAIMATPVLAASAPASKLSVTKSVRAGTTGSVKSSKLEGGSVFIAVAAAAAVIGGIVLAASGGNSKSK